MAGDGMWMDLTRAKQGEWWIDFSRPSNRQSLIVLINNQAARGRAGLRLRKKYEATSRPVWLDRCLTPEIRVRLFAR